MTERIVRRWDSIVSITKDIPHRYEFISDLELLNRMEFLEKLVGSMVNSEILKAQGIQSLEAKTI